VLLLLEAPPGFEPGIEALQAPALPLGDGAIRSVIANELWCPEPAWEPDQESLIYFIYGTVTLYGEPFQTLRL
jgi:hypothetical protein